MQQTLQASRLVPRGFVVADTASDDGGTSITVLSTVKASTCPGCGTRSERVHSRYRRRLMDLPAAGRPVRLVVLARRFYCHVVLCGRRIFAERFDADVLAPWARRTARLEHIVHHHEGYLRREQDNAVILGLARNGATIKDIVRRTGHSRGLVRTILRGQRSDVFRVRESSLELYLPWLDAQWAAGECNGAAPWRRLQQQGFRGCLRVVTEWAGRRRQAEKADGVLRRAPAAPNVAQLLTVGRDWLSKSEAVMVAAIEGGVPLLVEARDVAAAFQAMMRKRSRAVLEPWLERAQSSLLASFANGVLKDKATVAAAITSSWSNGQTEGQITKLKLVKRQMYGRGTLDLLQARVIGPA